MKRLGAYISHHADTPYSSPYLTKGCFVYYECDIDDYRKMTSTLKIWRLDANLEQQPDEVIYLFGKSSDELKKHIATHETWAKHYISYHGQNYRIRDMTCRFVTFPDIEVIDEMTVDAVDHYETWSHKGDSAYQFLKEAELTIAVFKRQVMPTAVDDMIKEELKKAFERSALNSYYGIATNPDPFKVVKIEEKETKTMEKKMTATDLFLKRLNGVTITSTYAKLDHGLDYNMSAFGDSYYIYYPEMEITNRVAENLITVLLLMRDASVHKLIFNPNKGTTTIKLRCQSVTVRCNESDDAEFDFVMGFVMANMKREFGSDDYNWFNKIKNHRKTHIEYTEKKSTKKGGKK